MLPEASTLHSRPYASRRTVVAAAVVATWTALCGTSTCRAQTYRTLRDDPSLGLTADASALVPLDWDLSAPGVDATTLPAIESDAIAAFDAWAAPTCSTFRGNYRGLTASAATRGDGRWTIAIITSGWVAAGLPDGRGATTDVQLRRDTSGVARIVEADIYVNFDQQDFALSGVPATGQLDLQGVLTHETGHLLGLLHPCEHGASGVPECDSTYESECMYPDYLGTSQRVLSVADVAGVCALYAAAPCSPACADGFTCVGGNCVPACPGAACPGGPTCDAGGCGDAAMFCTSDDMCASGACPHFGASHGQCAAAGTVGTVCTAGTECRSGLCVHSTRLGYALCTVACITDVDCGAEGTCAVVDATRVCALSAAPQAGCHVYVAGERAASGAPLAWFGLVAGLALWRFRLGRTR